MAEPTYELAVEIVDDLIELTVYQVSSKGKTLVESESYASLTDALFWAQSVLLNFIGDNWR